MTGAKEKGGREKKHKNKFVYLPCPFERWNMNILKDTSVKNNTFDLTISDGSSRFKKWLF